jgi:hypothetical protein
MRCTQARIGGTSGQTCLACIPACHTLSACVTSATVTWLLLRFPGDQLSPRGSTVTTSLPFAPGFGGAVGASHGRAAQGAKGDPDYTPPSNARCA